MCGAEDLYTGCRRVNHGFTSFTALSSHLKNIFFVVSGNMRSMVMNKAFCREWWCWQCLMIRESEHLCRLCIYSYKGKSLPPRWWKGFSVINLSPGDWLFSSGNNTIWGVYSYTLPINLPISFFLSSWLVGQPISLCSWSSVGPYFSRFPCNGSEQQTQVCCMLSPKPTGLSNTVSLSLY